MKANLSRRDSIIPKRLENEKKMLLKNLHDGWFERITKEDSNKNWIPIIYLETKGKGQREYLQRIHIGYADTGKIGDKNGEIYLHHLCRLNSFPKRFRVDSDRILKIVKDTNNNGK